MKPATNERSVEGSLPGRKVELGLQQDATAHLMNVLTDLYTDRELAVLREYATNALDAHVQAGTPGPIAVTTPTSLAPFVTIQDWGVGLSEDELAGVYTQYGASTKRDSDEATGMLGLGCKAALTYGETFTVIAVKDGERVQASITRSPEGGGALTIMDVRETTEANGVTVQIPAERSSGFQQKAVELFSYWEPSTVELNGELPTPARAREDVVLKLADDLYVQQLDQSDYADDRHLVVQGGIPYPARIPDLGLPVTQRLVAHVPIGTVHFPPSRETLLDGPNTDAALADIAERYKRELASALQKDIDAQPDRPAALVKLKAHGAFGVSDRLNYRGTPFPERTERLPLAARSYDRVKSRVRAEALEPGIWPELVWITGFTPAKFSAAHRNKLDAIAAERGWPQPGKYVLLGYGGADYADAQPLPAAVSSWVDPELVVDWSDLKAPGGADGGARKNRPRRKSPVYDKWDGRDWVPDAISAEHLKRACAKRTVLYVHPHGERPTRWGAHPDTKLANRVKAVQQLRPDALIVRVPRNREERFLRLVPEAVLAWDAAKADARAYVAGLPDVTKRLLARRYEVGSYGTCVYAFHRLDPNLIEDARVRELVEAEAELAHQLDAIDLTALVNRLDHVRIELRVGFTIDREEDDPRDYLREHYPLVDWADFGSDLDKHATLYVNAAYHAKQNQG